MKLLKIELNVVKVILPGLILMITGILLERNLSGFKTNAVKHKAKISYIETSRDSEGELECFVNVTYRVHGRLYTDSLDVCNVDWTTGEELTILYDPENPGLFMTSFSYYICFTAVAVLIISGAAVFIAGLYLLFVKSRLNKILK